MVRHPRKIVLVRVRVHHQLLQQVRHCLRIPHQSVRRADTT